MANTRTACSRAFSQKILHPKSQCSAWRQEMEPKGMINTKLSNSKNKLIRSKLIATFFIVPCCVDSPLWTISLCQQVVSGASATVSSNGPRQLGTKTQIQMLSSTYSATRLLIYQIEYRHSNLFLYAPLRYIVIAHHNGRYSRVGSYIACMVG